ncbi:MAG: CHASE2 domain-containing protein [Myxococcaceae bacterium]
MASSRRFQVLAVGVAALFVGLQSWMEKRETGAGVGWGAAFPQLLQEAEHRASDIQFRIRGHRAPHPDVVVAVVDEASVQRHGRWPWPRAKVAQALAALHDLGVRAVGLDIIFAEDAHDPAGDAALAEVFRRAPEIVQGVIAYQSDAAPESAARVEAQRKLALPHVIGTLPGKAPGSVFEVPWASVLSMPFAGLQTPVAEIAQSSVRWGHFHAKPDLDGALRRMPPFVKLSDPPGLVPALALQISAAYFGGEVQPVWRPEDPIDPDDPWKGKLTHARVSGPSGTRDVPISLNEPYVLVDYPGPRSVFPTISLGDLVDGRVPKEAVTGKAVVVGVALLGLYDQVVTPFAAPEVGVFTQASLLSNVLEGRHLVRPHGLLLLEIAFTLATALLLAWRLPRASFRWKVALALLPMVAWGVLDQMLFSRGLQLATVLPLAHVVTSAVALMFLAYLTVDREKGQLRVAFSRYLSPAVMDEILAHPERLKLGGEKRELTVLFSDIRGFTTISESMAPEVLVRFINSYLTPMTEIVLQEGGTLDKYIGDAIMAFWNAPVEQPDHALRACRTALRLLERLETLRGQWRAEGLPELDIGVGISSGSMVVGNMGSDLRFDYTVMGDAVNLGSRLEGANKDYGTRVLISEETYARVSGQVVARRLGAVRLKGKQKRVGIYELRAVGQPSAQDTVPLEKFERALGLHESGQLGEALALFQEVHTLWPHDGPTQRYINDITQQDTA